MVVEEAIEVDKSSDETAVESVKVEEVIEDESDKHAEDEDLAVVEEPVAEEEQVEEQLGQGNFENIQVEEDPTTAAAQLAAVEDQIIEEVDPKTYYQEDVDIWGSEDTEVTTTTKTVITEERVTYGESSDETVVQDTEAKPDENLAEDLTSNDQDVEIEVVRESFAGEDFWSHIA